jgi:hypothetical protein
MSGEDDFRPKPGLSVIPGRLLTISRVNKKDYADKKSQRQNN